MAAVTSITYGLRAANSTSFTFTAPTDAVSDFTNAQLIAGLATTNSPLYTFLSTAHASASAADIAFRALGGRIDFRQTAGTAGTSTFVTIWVASSAVPALKITGVGSTDYVADCTIAVLQSISQ